MSGAKSLLAADFYALVNWLEQVDADLPERGGVGSSIEPAQERERLLLTAVGSPRHPTREIERVDPIGEASPLAVEYQVAINNGGLIGADSPLPTHITYQAMGTLEKGDGAARIRTFLDVLHHRIYSLRYRAWKKRRAVYLAEPSMDDEFTELLDALQGNLPHERVGSDTLGRDHFFGHGEALLHGIRSGDHLRTALAGALRGSSFKIEEFVERRMPIADCDRTALTTRAHGARDKAGLGRRLGEDCVLGDSITECVSTVVLAIGPLPYHKYVALLPGGTDRQRVDAIAEEVLPLNVRHELRLTVEVESAPGVRLGESGSLAWSAWLGGPGESSRSVAFEAASA